MCGSTITSAMMAFEAQQDLPHMCIVVQLFSRYLPMVYLDFVGCPMHAFVVLLYGSTDTASTIIQLEMCNNYDDVCGGEEY